MIIELSVWLIGGLIFSLIIGLIYSIGKESNNITTVERTYWSWGNITKNYEEKLKKVVLRWWIFGFIFGLIFSLIFGVNFQLLDGLTFSILYSFIFGIIGLLLCGWEREIPQTTTIPNEGIKLTLRSSIKGLIVGLIIGLIVGLIAWLIGGAIGGLVVSLIGWLWFGGINVIRHYTLRFIIYLKGYGPWNYAKFLDYAVDELHFMQRVGGGYIFIHRMLLEHFAEMEDAEVSGKEKQDEAPAPHTD